MESGKITSITQFQTSSLQQQERVNIHRAKVMMQLKTIIPRWNYTSEEHKIMGEYFFRIWDTEEAKSDPNAFAEKQLNLLKDIDAHPDLRIACFDVIESNSDNFEEVFSTFLKFEEAVQESERLINLVQAQSDDTPEYIEIYKAIMTKVTSTIKASHTAIRVNLHNSMKESHKEILKQAISDFNVQKNGASPQDPEEFYPNYAQERKCQAILNQPVFDQLGDYYTQLTMHNAVVEQAKNGTSLGQSPLPIMILFSSQAHVAACQELANLTILKLLASNIPENIKWQDAKLLTIGPNPTTGTTHMCILIGELTNPKNAFVLDPWMHYVTHTTEGTLFSCDGGFCGKLADYINTYNRIADGYALPNYEDGCKTDPPFVDQEGLKILMNGTGTLKELFD